MELLSFDLIKDDLENIMATAAESGSCGECGKCPWMGCGGCGGCLIPEDLKPNDE